MLTFLKFLKFETKMARHSIEGSSGGTFDGPTFSGFEARVVVVDGFEDSESKSARVYLGRSLESLL